MMHDISISISATASAFGLDVRRRREALRLTRRQLAGQIGCSIDTIRKIETGERQPSQQMADLLAKHLDIARDARSGPAQSANHLGLPLTSFIGREKEIAELTVRLRTERLLTLTGAGGSGKTRLAVEVARRSAGGFADGAWLVDLSPISDPSLVAQRIVEVLELSELATRPPADTIIAHLENRYALLILDNCEHVIGACAELLERLLGCCLRVHVLATSRETLNIPAEATFRVPSLTTPGPSPLDVSSEQALHYEAVRLFVERAGAAQPAFELTPAHTTAVAQICQRLDGIPLALELAAALTSTLTVAEIAARLQDHPLLLSDGYRTAPPRHQTMRAALDWSFALLTPSEQHLLARLSAFAGGWTTEAAEAVNGDGSDVLPRLHQLIRKSLVIAVEWDGHMRYRMLEPIRQYAAEKLAERGESDVVRERHFRYFLDFAERMDAGLGRARVASWIAQLEADHDNLRAALIWWRDSAHSSDDGLRLAASLQMFWELLDDYREGVTWLRDIIKRGPPSSAGSRARALHSLMWLGNFTAEPDLTECATCAEDCLDRCRAEGDQLGVAHSSLVLGCVACSRRDYSQVIALVAESLEQFEVIRDQRSIWHAHTLLACALREQGNRTQAIATLEGYLARTGSNGDRLFIWHVLYQLAYEYMSSDMNARASVLLQRAFALADEMDYHRGLWWVCGDLAAADLPNARSLAERFLTQERRRGDKNRLAMALHALGGILLDVAEYDRAGALLDESLALWRELGIWWRKCDGFGGVAIGRGQVARFQHDYDLAIAFYSKGITLFKEAANTYMISVGSLYRGYAFLARGEVERAVDDFRESLKAGREDNDRANIGALLAAISELMHTQGWNVQAVRLAGAASALEADVRELRPNSQMDYLRNVAAARQLLDDPAFAAAWAEGRAMTLNQAVEEAFAALDSRA